MRAGELEDGGPIAGPKGDKQEGGGKVATALAPRGFRQRAVTVPCQVLTAASHSRPDLPEVVTEGRCRHSAVAAAAPTAAHYASHH